MNRDLFFVGMSIDSDRTVDAKIPRSEGSVDLNMAAAAGDACGQGGRVHGVVGGNGVDGDVCGFAGCVSGSNGQLQLAVGDRQRRDGCTVSPDSIVDGPIIRVRLPWVERVVADDVAIDDLQARLRNLIGHLFEISQSWRSRRWLLSGRYLRALCWRNVRDLAAGEIGIPSA